MRYIKGGGKERKRKRNEFHTGEEKKRGGKMEEAAQKGEQNKDKIILK